jgi:hypothetical protein
MKDTLKRKQYGVVKFKKKNRNDRQFNESFRSELPQQTEPAGKDPGHCWVSLSYCCLLQDRECFSDILKINRLFYRGGNVERNA